MARDKWLHSGKARIYALVLWTGVGLAWPEAVRAGYASFVMDADTGQVLHADSADNLNYPASLTKMMTLYMLFQALAEERLTLATPMKVSAHAIAQSPSRLNLPLGAAISVENAILALVTKSANDVACVVAETLGGSESDFAVMMTITAHRLGMHNTMFRNASGLPNKMQITTARDMATLGLALIRNHPQYYHYFSTRRFQYGAMSMLTHNRLLLNYDGADGIKTGYIAASGFNLVTSAKRDGKRLLGVVLGGTTSHWRDAHMADLLDAAFARLTDKTVLMAKRTLPLAQKLAQVTSQSTRVIEQRTPAEKKAAHQIQLDSLVHRTLNTPAEARIKGPPTPPTQTVRATPLGPKAAQEVSRSWGIQLSSFRKVDEARTSATLVISRLKALKSKPSVVIITAKVKKGITFYRARLMGMTRKEAQTACTRVPRQQGLLVAPICHVVHPSGELAHAATE